MLEGVKCYGRKAPLGRGIESGGEAVEVGLQNGVFTTGEVNFEQTRR